MKKLVKVGSVFALALAMLTGVSLTSGAVKAQAGAVACTVGEDGSYKKGDKASCEGQAGELKGKMLTFVKILSTLVVVFAVGMIIYGGFKYITSQGDPRQAETAKSQIWYAGVGLFIVIAAFTILQLFMNASGGL